MEEQEAEIERLRAEVADLNELLVESARTLSEVNKKYAEERETNAKLIEYIHHMERNFIELQNQNELLQQEASRNHSSTGGPALLPSSQSGELLQKQRDLTESIKALADDLVDKVAAADVDAEMLLQKFPSVIFERKPPEEDPYKSTKGWVGRRSPTKKSASEATIAEDPIVGVNLKDRDFSFGSPSERYPLTEPNGEDSSGGSSPASEEDTINEES